LLIVLSLGTALSPVYAGGGKDPELSRADELIKDKLYDQAIVLLSEYIKTNPDKFDYAQRRLQKIIRLREDYNAIAQTLLDVIENQPEDVDRIYALTTQLENMASPQNTATQDFIRRVRVLAEFTINRRRLERILADGRALLDREDYVGAMRAYAGGLDIYREAFFNAGYGELVENQVNAGIQNINAGIDALAALNDPVRAAVTSLEELSARDSPDITQIRNVYQRLQPELNQVAALKNSLIATESYFEKQLALIREQDPSLGDRSFLSFAGWLLRGRSSDIQEGMIGAAAGLWMNAAGRYERSFAALTDRMYRTAYTSAANREYTAALSQFRAAAGYIELPRESVKAWNQFREGENVPVREIFDQPVVPEKTGDYFRYEAMSRAVGLIVEAETLGERFLNAAEGEDQSWPFGAAANAMQSELAAQRSFADLHNQVLVLSDRVDEEARLLEEYNNATVRAPMPSYMRDARAIVSGLDSDIAFQINNASARRYAIANRELERRLTQRRSQFEEGNNLLLGHEKEVAGGIITAKYPVEAAAVLTRMEQDIAADLEIGTVLMTQYKRENPQVLASPQMQEMYNSAQSLVNRIESLQTEGHSRGETARNLAAQAEALRIDGDRLYQEAVAALGRNNFDVARDRLTRTGDRYDASLAIEESDSLRNIRDTRLLNLGAEITRLENERIIREVRELVTSARTSYFAGNFEPAEEMLVRAQNRWRVTNPETNAEVDYWLTIVRGALNLRSGRTIPPTAPLYPEMSQLLSEAKKNYDEGVRFFNASRRQEGLARFTAAREKTREVKLLFPINEDAGLLDLRMDQVTDPRAFDASFRQRLDNAVAGTERKSTEAYADLQNLAAINPRYPGMRAILDRAEIAMGIRPPPPDPRDLAQSEQLTAQALVIINDNLRTQFEVARTQLTQAIRLDPNNSRAQEAMDRVQTMIGGGDTIVLSSAVEAEYQRAVRELQQGNTINAMVIVQQLLQDSRNRTGRILDLQRRIESML
jgi:hypothetical protein